MTVTATVRKQAKKEWVVARDQRRTGMLFVGLPLLLFLVFSVYPMLYAGYLSFTEFTFTQPPTFIGLQNFERLMSDRVFHAALWNTTVYTVGVVLGGVALSFVVALLLNQQIRGVTIFRTAYYMPVITSTVAAGMIWLWLYAPAAGLINQVLGVFGIPPQKWLLDPQLALLSIMIMAIWKNLGFTMLIFLAALQGIPSHLYESAELDGANGWHKVWSITLPLIRPATFFIFVTAMISSFQVFGSVYVMTKGGPGYATMTIVMQIYLNAFRYLRMGYASAQAIVLFAIIFTLALINWRFLRSDVEYW